MRREDLVEVLIATDGVKRQVGPGQTGGQRGDDVVGLKAGHAQDRDSDGLDDTDDAIHLHRQVFGRELTLGLVFGVNLHAEDRAIVDVQGHGEVVGAPVAQQVQQHL